MQPLTLPTTLTLALLAATCTPTPTFQDPFTRPQITWTPPLTLDLPAAQRILGNPARLEKSSSFLDAKTKTYISAFRDDWLDPQTQKTGILYYMYEEYPTDTAASSFLNATLKDNHINPADALHINGAAIHYLKGGPIIRMSLILKGPRLIRLKANQLTSRYSLEEFQKVTTELASQM